MGGQLLANGIRDEAISRHPGVDAHSYLSDKQYCINFMISKEEVNVDATFTDKK
jgi:hypothetical protein